MHRIWSEMLPFRELVTDETCELLRRYRLFPLVAVRPDDLDELPRLLEAFARHGIELALWPMLSDEDGRWLSGGNALAFRAFTERILELAIGTTVREVALDLEPPIEDVRALLARRPRLAPAPGRVDDTRAVLHGLVARIHASGFRASAAVLPPIALPNGARWERRLGTPVRGIDFDHVSVMLYTSMIEGWSMGALGRRHAREALGRLAATTLQEFGSRGGVSLGVVSTGAFGDEPIYRGPDELLDDVALARAAGITTLTLFDLAGVVRRPPAAAWLDVFTGTAVTPSSVRASKRIRALVRILRHLPELPRRRS